MLETLYLSMCRQRGPNSPPEPLNLEERDCVSQKQEKARKEGWLRLRNKRELKREKKGKRDGVRPEGSDERLSWFMFLCIVFPVILSPVLRINAFRTLLIPKKKLSKQRRLQPPYTLRYRVTPVSPLLP